MGEIIAYRTVIILLIILLGSNILITNFYRSKYKNYRERLTNAVASGITDKDYRKVQQDKLSQEIAILKSIINKLSFIIRGKHAILAKDKLRFTYSVRANGKRVARVKSIGDITRPTSVMGEDMVEISKDTYIKASKLHDILRCSIGNNKERYLSIEDQISNSKQYSI